MADRNTRQPEGRDSIRYLGFLLSLAIIGTHLVACPIPKDDNLSLNDNTGELDPTQYGGLTIVGELTTEMGTSNELVTTRGPLNLITLQASITSKCFDDLVTHGDIFNPMATKCEDWMIWDESDDSLLPGERCWRAFCLSEIARCTAQRNMELAENIDVYTLEVDPFTTHVEADVSYLSFTFDDEQRDSLHSYRVPPIPPKSKTLAYLAAQNALRISGNWAVKALTMHEPMIDPFNCIQELKDNELPAPAQSVHARDLLIVGYAETITQYGEVTRKLVENQLNVAASNLSKNPDFATAQNEMWNEGLNSHFAALRGLLNKEMTESPLCGCPARISRPTDKKALALLRSARLLGTVQDDDTMSTDELVGKVAKKYYGDIGVPESEAPDSVTFMDGKGLSLSNFDYARAYLKQEETALDRLHPVDDDDEERGFGFHKRAFQNPASFYLTDGTLAEAPCYGGFLCEAYGNIGAVQAIDYFRHTAVKSILDAHSGEITLETDHLKTLASAVMVSGSLIGESRVEVGVSGSEIKVALHGSSEGDLNALYLLSTKEGYRCAVEGSIDGKQCTEDEIEKSLVNPVVVYEHVPDPLDRRYPLDRSVLLLFEANDLAPGALFYLVRWKGRGSSELVATITGTDTQTCNGYAVVALSNSTMEKLVNKTTQRTVDRCGLPTAPCGDIGISRDYVPPLESELTENADPYANNYRHYLALAKQAADEADRLGDDLVAAGLEIDRASEASQSELEKICGGVVNLDPFDAFDNLCDFNVDPDCSIVAEQLEANPSLQNCLPEKYGGGMERIPYTVMGSTGVCVFTGHTERLCECNEGDESCKELECPILDSSAQSQSGCATAFAGLEPGYTVHYVEDTLNLFQADSEEDSTPAGCNREIVDLLESASEAASYSSHFSDLVQELYKRLDWLGSNALVALLQRIELVPHMLHHYTLRVDGQTLWTTLTNDHTKCPVQRPWMENSPIVPCVREDNAVALNAPDTGTADQADWLWTELNESNGYAWERQSWGQRIFRNLSLLGAMAGYFSHLTVRVRRDQEGGYSQNIVVDNVRPRVPLIRGIVSDDLVASYCINRSRYENTHIDVYNLLLYLADDENVGVCALSGNGDGIFRVDSAKTGYVSAEYYDGWLDFKDSIPRIISYDPTLSDQHSFAYFADDGSVRVTKDGFIFTTYSYNNEYTFYVYQAEILDSFKMACHLRQIVESGQDIFTVVDFGTIPELDSGDDIVAMRDYVYSMSQKFYQRAQKVIVPNLPAVFAGGYSSGTLQGLYPDFQGENLKTLLRIEDALNGLSSSTQDIKKVLKSIGVVLGQLVIIKDKFAASEDLNNLATVRAVLGNIIGAANAVTAGPKGWIFNPVAIAGYIALTVVDQKIGAVKERINGLDEDLAYKQHLLSIIDHMGQFQAALDNIEKSYRELQAGLTDLDSNGLRATKLLGSALGLDSDAAEHVFHSNTVVRRRYNTLRYRYEEKSKAAKKLAWVARRAIEFRLGVDMSTMEDDVMLVPPASTWADSICEMQGFDYRKLREADPDDPLFDPDLADSDSYENWYIGDYVRRLELFVEGYNMAFPSSDEDDFAVISMKNDLMRVRGQCLKKGKNHLYFSGDLGQNATVAVDESSNIKVGWTRSGCSSGVLLYPEPSLCDPAVETCSSVDNCVTAQNDPTSGLECSENFCFELNEGWVGSDVYDGYFEIEPRPPAPPLAERLSDPYPDESSARIEEWTNSGYVRQRVEDLADGYYVLSWWDRHPQDLVDAAVPPVQYRVQVVLDDGTGPFEVVPDVLVGPSGSSWDRKNLGVYLEQETGVEIRFYPSDATSTHETPEASREFGDVWIWGMQLERINPYEVDCEGSACLLATPTTYVNTEGSLLTQSYDCEDTDGADMRKLFEYHCTCIDKQNGVCGPEDAASPYKKCYWEYPFNISLAAIEKSESIPSNNIAIGNFNYRQGAVALNIVGTDVIDCSQSDSPSTCYANAFVPYTFEHSGQVDIRNHEGATMSYDMPTARVEHGKCLAAEVLVTNPISSNTSQLLSEYWKDGLRGRPLQGHYRLRIWETPALRWNAIEDIQVVWKYRYWTKMTISD